MKQLSYSLYIFLLLCLSGCESQGGAESYQILPKIGEVQTSITHYHSDFFSKWSDETNRTIDFSFAVQVTDPQGLRNLYHILALDNAREEYYALLGGDREFYSFSAWYKSYFQGFERTVYNIYEPDRVNLQDWSMYAVDGHNNTTTRNFEFTLPDGEPVVDQQYVYSSTYETPDTDGIPALEAMTIAENNLSIVADIETESYLIEFDVSDERAKYYAFWFYDSDINPEKIATVDERTTPIVFGQKVSVQLPWSDIQFASGYTTEDVFGVHIVLMDDPVEFKYLENDFRPSYLGVSEYLVLP